MADEMEEDVLILLGTLMAKEEKPFMYCCKCLTDDSADAGLLQCPDCGQWMCSPCSGKRLACCDEEQKNLDEHYGKEHLG